MRMFLQYPSDTLSSNHSKLSHSYCTSVIHYTALQDIIYIYIFTHTHTHIYIYIYIYIYIHKIRYHNFAISLIALTLRPFVPITISANAFFVQPANPINFLHQPYSSSLICVNCVRNFSNLTLFILCFLSVVFYWKTLPVTNTM